MLVAVAVLSANLARSRRAINQHRMPGQRRIHFTGERNSRRLIILDTIMELGVAAVVYDATGHPDQIQGRAACLAELVADAAEWKASRLVLEIDDAAAQADRALLYGLVRDRGLVDNLRYYHMRAHEECLLALPDAVAWCWAKGGRWRERVRPVITDVRYV